MTRTVQRLKPHNTKASNLSELRKLAKAQPHNKAFRQGIGKKGIYNRRIIIDATFGSHDYILHATKGWRRRRRVGVL